MDSGRLSTPMLRLYWYGSSTPTVDQTSPPGAHLLIKGRPFYLASKPALDTLFDSLGAMESALRNLDGKFSLLAVSSTGELLCATDLLESGSIYHFTQENRLYVSTHLGLLLAALPRFPALDPIGLVSVLATRRSLTGATPWEGASRLPAGSYLLVNTRPDGALQWTTNTYLDVVDALSAPTPSGEPAALVEGYDELLRQSLVRERYDETTAVMLSGGRDSQMLALALRKNTATEFGAVTFGAPGSTDVRGASQLARRLELPHRVAPYDSWHLGTYAEAITSHHAGATGLQVSYHLPGFEAAQSSFRTAIVGHLGNRLALPRNSGVERSLEEEIRKRTTFWGKRTSHLLERHYPNEYAEVIGFLKRDLEARQALPPQQRMAAGLARGTAWHALTFDIGESSMEVSYPFFYRPLLAYALSLPIDLLKDSSLYALWWTKAERDVANNGSPGERWNADPLPIPGSRVRTGARELRILDWPELIRRSASWLADKAARYCDDVRLRSVCENSLRDHLNGDGSQRPLIMLGLPAALTRSVVRERATL